MNIYALSSGRGPSGIAIIRLSGKGTLKIAKLISKQNNLKPKEVNFCKFYNPTNDSLIDEGFLLLFLSPNSFTGDDLAEFHIHGSNAVITCFLRVLSMQVNSRLAEPGEFTKIAFQNNKIDLIEAESIGDLIHSETELQRQQAVKLVQGKASNYYNNLRKKLIKSLAYIEAKIDFAEDDLPDSIFKEVQKSIKEVHNDIKKILEEHKVGEKIRDGFRISIIGEVNAGKSSLLNLLSKRDVAIVSEEEGTTRDVIETYLNIDGYPVILADTAGIRDSKDEIEKKGIKLALKRAEEADLRLVVIEPKNLDFTGFLKDLFDENSILIINKSDLLKKKLDPQIKKLDHVLISIIKNSNLDILINKIINKLKNKFISSEDILITRERHRQHLEQCVKYLINFTDKNKNDDLDKGAEDLRLATRHLGMIVGKVDVEEILGSIFNDFCIGK